MPNSPNVLFLGPLPPPIGGYVSLFLAITEAWQRRTGKQPTIVDTSPGRVKSHPGVGQVQDLWRGIRIARQLLAGARTHDAAVFVATTGLFQRMMPVIRHVRRRHDLPFVVWFSGGVIHEVIQALPPARQKRIVADLNALDTVVVETDLVRTGMQALGVEKLLAVPNPRVIDPEQLSAPRSQPASAEGLRIVYFSRIVEDKGIFVLLEAVRRLANEGVRVQVDCYGTIDPDYSMAFEVACRETPGARYAGIYTGDAPELLARYDVMALPTWFPREGHPGVLVEAMMAGIPVVATHHMAIPELVTDGENGLLVPPRDAGALCDALRTMAHDPLRRAAMGAAHRKRLGRHDAVEAAGKLLERLIDVSAKHAYTSSRSD